VVTEWVGLKPLNANEIYKLVTKLQIRQIEIKIFVFYYFFTFLL